MDETGENIDAVESDTRSYPSPGSFDDSMQMFARFGPWRCPTEYIERIVAEIAGKRIGDEGILSFDASMELVESVGVEDCPKENLIRIWDEILEKRIGDGTEVRVAGNE